MANKTLTPVDSWDDPKSPVNGDTDDQTLDEDCHQRAANRTQHIYNAVLAPGGSGAVKIRTVATSVALKALTGMSAGDVAMLADTGRMYQFTTSTPPPQMQQSGYAYQANDTTGWWQTSRGGDWQTVVAKHVAADLIDPGVGDYITFTGDTDWHDITDGATPMSLTLDDAIEDDEIKVTAHFPAFVSANTAVFRAVVTYGGTDYEVAGSGSVTNTTSITMMVCNGRHVVGAGGASAPVVKLQAKLSSGSDTVHIGDTSVYLEAELLRPAP